MNDRTEAHARARQSFPRPAPNVAALADGELATWARTCMLQRVVAARWSVDGWRWRRAASRATKAFRNRVIAHAGPSPAPCDRCGTRPATRHVACRPHDAPRFAHFCSTCSPAEPPGWFAITQSG